MTKISDIDWALTDPPQPDRPRLTDDNGLRRVLRYHVAERAVGWGKLTAVGAIRALPTRTTSMLVSNAFLPLALRTEGRRPYAKRMADVAHTLSPSLWPKNDPDNFIERWFSNVANVYAQYAIAERLGSPEHCKVEGLHLLEAAREGGRPFILASVHTGTWELISHFGSHHTGRNVTGPWSPEPNKYDNLIVCQSRRRQGIKVLTPGPHLPRLLLQVLKEPGQGLVMMMDAVADGKTPFPLFGRPMPQRGNFVFTLRLAQKSGAVLVPVTIERTAPTEHRVRYHGPVEVGPGGDGIAAAARTLNILFEDFVRSHLDQWYMMHNLKRGDLAHWSAR